MLRPISTSGAMIDGVEFPGSVDGMTVQIELSEGRLMPATMRWANNGQAGLQFGQPVNVDQLGPPIQRANRA